MVESEAKPGLVVAVRVLVRSLSTKDPVRLALSFRADEEARRSKADWADTFNTLRVSLTGPEGHERTLVAAGSVQSPSQPPLFYQSIREVRISDQGIDEARFKWHADWSKRVDKLFPSAGQYQLKLAGDVKVAAETIQFESREMRLDVAADATVKSLDQIETIASEFVKQHKKQKDAPRMPLPTVEDEAGHRVVRFLLRGLGPSRYRDDFCEVIVSRTGEVLSLVSQIVFTCVAEGTAIATPRGPRPVETISVGESVLAYDVVSGRPVHTRVRAVAAAYSNSLFALTDQLTVSARHPVYADGAWVEAQAVEPGAALLGIGGRQLATPRAIATGGTVYDLSVEWPHNYFAGGVLVHNKAVESPEARNIRTNIDARPDPGRPAAK